MVQVYYITLSIFVCEMTDKMINHLNKPYFLSLFFSSFYKVIHFGTVASLAQ